MHDQLSGGRSYRLFNAIEDFNRMRLGIEVDFSMPAERVIRMRKLIIGWHGEPDAIRCDNGPAYISGQLMPWVKSRRIAIDYIQATKL